MRLIVVSLMLLLAHALTPARAQTVLPGLTEGVHYQYIEGGQPYQAQPPGMVEIAEVFAYTCPHCAHFAPMLEKWAKQLPAHAKLVLVTGVFNRDDTWSRAFFAARSSKSLAVLHPRLFAAIHDSGELPHNASAAQIIAFASKVQGVDAKAFKAAMQDDDKQLPQLKEAYDFARRSGIEGTPSLIVAGRYRILGNSYESLLANARSVVLALAPKKPSPAGAGKPAAASRSATPARP